jgi:hypothetical protein
MELIVKACVILHNMACDESRHGYTGSRAVRLDAATSEFANEDEVPITWPPNDTAEAAAF